jgi:Zn-dependent M16 (insulinase) family peptidase
MTHPPSTYIYFYEDERATRGDLAIYVGSVPVEHLASFPDRLRASLARIVEEGLDMERMAMVINRDERQLRSKIESSKGDAFSTTVISDFLYGKEDGSELRQALDDIDSYRVLRKWSGKQWADLLKKLWPNNISTCSQTNYSFSGTTLTPLRSSSVGIPLPLWLRGWRRMRKSGSLLK